MMSKIGKALTNVFVYKVVLMFFMIPTLLVQAVTFNYKLLFVMLFWGALLCLYDLFTKRVFLKAQGMLWLLLFLISFTVSVALNIKTAPNLNVATWGYTVITLLLLYPNHIGQDKQRVLREISVINYIFIAMTTVLSTVSFAMYVISYVRLVSYGDQTYVIGWGNNRLFGLYWNTGFMITAIGLALLVIQVVIIKSQHKKIKPLLKVFFIYTAILNFVCMCLENAKGAYISLAAFVAVFAFYLVGRFLAKRGLSAVKNTLLAGVAALLAAVALFGAIYAVRPVLAYVPGLYRLMESNEQILEKEIEKQEIERDIPENYGALTGRPKIWKFGLEQFLQKPIFGYGPNSHREYHVVDTGLRHFHNFIIQSLVSVGIVGSVFIFIYLLKTFIKGLVLLLKQRYQNSPYIFVAWAFFALLVMFFVNSMAEVTILFMMRFSSVIFWIYLGYFQILLDDKLEGKDDAFFARLCNKLFCRKSTQK